MLDKIYKDKDKFYSTENNFNFNVITPKKIITSKKVVTAKKTSSGSQVFKSFFINEKNLGTDKAYEKSCAII